MPLMAKASAGVLKKASNFSGGGGHSGDEATRLGVTATSELADEEVVAERPKSKGSQSHAPWSVQPITRVRDAAELACGSVNVHEA